MKAVACITLFLAYSVSMTPTLAAPDSPNSVTTSHARSDPCEGTQADWVRASVADIKKQAELAQRERPLLNEIMNLSAKAKNPKEAVDKQLSSEDIQTFNQARAQVIYLEDAKMMSSETVRDMKFVLDLCLAAHRIAGWRDEYLDTMGPSGPAYSAWMTKAVEKDSKNEALYDTILLTIADRIPTQYDRQMQQMSHMEQIKKRATQPAPH